MKIIVSSLFALSALAGATLLCSTPVSAHSWYPKECCSNDDCAQVTATSRLILASGGLPQLIVTSKHGTAIVPQDFPVRESRDGRMHVCMRPDPWGGMDVICLFMPPHM